MPTPAQIARYVETLNMACRWYVNSQNTDEHPWGGISDSADSGRFVYEYFPAKKSGRGAGSWAQALGIMALHSANLRSTHGWDPDRNNRTKAAVLAGRYLLSLQYTDKSNPAANGALAEHVPGEEWCYPRDGATGGMGLCALHRMTGEEKYLAAAKDFCDWYGRQGCDEERWPLPQYNFVTGQHLKAVSGEKAGPHDTFIKGDWQAGGALCHFYTSCLSGDARFIEDYMMPMIEPLVEMYNRNPVDEVTEGFHGKVEVSYGNDDFALIALLAAYRWTDKKEYLDLARERIRGLIGIMDAGTGLFPSYGGTFVSGIEMKVLCELDKAEGRKPDAELLAATELIAEGGMKLQACNYDDLFMHGAFWGQSDYGVGRDWIHHRSTGYATIFYSMMEGREPMPYFNCLRWELPEK